VFPVKYELSFYIPEDDILHSHGREKLKPYTRCSSYELSDGNVKNKQARHFVDVIQ
jgi:hypothetical protein